ncbi:MAG: exonuclease domain-containing protein [Lachnospiraceae bacterium]|nr:exonuclease domain-containing protein [Lachnospiraceae bacterium]
MNYIVFDLEWNQCPQGKARENPRLPFEIVEIGAIKLNEEKETIDSFHEVIRPLVYRKLHFRTREVIHIDQEELNAARTFCPVIRDFLAWCGEDYEFVSWGRLDINDLKRNMDYYRIQNPFPQPLFYYDLQKMFSLLYDDGKSRSSLIDAVEYLQIPETMPFHRAFDDTYYTAEVMKRMDMEPVARYESVDYHRIPASREEEIFLDFGTYLKYVSRSFADKEEAMKDRRVCSLRCSCCNLPVWKRARWFSTGGNTYLSLVQCPKHGYMKGKIRLKKCPDGGVFVVKTIKPADERSVKMIREKKDAIKKRRKDRRRKKEGMTGKKKKTEHVRRPAGNIPVYKAI